jgi:hypothetical protein
MTEWLLNNLQTIIGVAELLGFAAIGGLIIFGVFGSKLGDRRAESDRVADGLIERLQKTVDQNAVDMTAMGKRMDDQQKEIHLLQGQNEAYLKLISLRDPKIAAIFDEAPEIYTIARETHALAQAQVDALKRLTDTMEEFINRLPPLTPIMHP